MMQENDIKNIWKSYEQQLDKALELNKQLTLDVTKLKITNIMNRSSRIKKFALVIGIPYLCFLYFLVFIGIKSGGVFFTIGFSIIAFISTIVTFYYFYHLYLINKIDNSDTILTVQESLSKLKISTYQITRIAFLQIPFWSLCWISLDIIKNGGIVYGMINLVIFIVLLALSFWLYKTLNINNMDHKLNTFFFSGPEWDPIVKSITLLEQVKEYKTIN